MLSRAARSIGLPGGRKIIPCLPATSKVRASFGPTGCSMGVLIWRTADESLVLQRFLDTQPELSQAPIGTFRRWPSAARLRSPDERLESSTASGFMRSKPPLLARSIASKGESNETVVAGGLIAFAEYSRTPDCRAGAVRNSMYHRPKYLENRAQRRRAPVAHRSSKHALGLFLLYDSLPSPEKQGIFTHRDYAGSCCRSREWALRALRRPLKCARSRNRFVSSTVNCEHEHVDGSDTLGLTTQEAAPGRRLRSAFSYHVLGYGRLSHLKTETELEELLIYPRCTPKAA